jgi:hypothetical protein
MSCESDFGSRQSDITYILNEAQIEEVTILDYIKIR